MSQPSAITSSKPRNPYAKPPVASSDTTCILPSVTQNMRSIITSHTTSTVSTSPGFQRKRPFQEMHSNAAIGSSCTTSLSASTSSSSSSTSAAATAQGSITIAAGSIRNPYRTKPRQHPPPNRSCTVTTATATATSLLLPQTTKSYRKKSAKSDETTLKQIIERKPRNTSIEITDDIDWDAAILQIPTPPPSSSPPRKKIQPVLLQDSNRPSTTTLMTTKYPKETTIVQRSVASAFSPGSSNTSNNTKQENAYSIRNPYLSSKHTTTVPRPGSVRPRPTAPPKLPLPPSKTERCYGDDGGIDWSSIDLNHNVSDILQTVCPDAVQTKTHDKTNPHKSQVVSTEVATATMTTTRVHGNGIPIIENMAISQTSMGGSTFSYPDIEAPDKYVGANPNVHHTTVQSLNQNPRNLIEHPEQSAIDLPYPSSNAQDPTTDLCSIQDQCPRQQKKESDRKEKCNVVIRSSNDQDRLERPKHWQTLDTPITDSVEARYSIDSSSGGASKIGSSRPTSVAQQPQPCFPGITPLPPELVYDEKRVQPVDDDFRLSLIKNANLNARLLNGWKLLPHQKQGILRAIKMRRLVVAFDMGLGKTLIGCIWANAFKTTFPDLKIYVIAPASLKTEWARTALKTTGLKSCEDSSRKDDGTDPTKSLDMHISSWAKIPQHVPNNVKHYVVICDEAHSMQSMASARTKDTLHLIRGKRCVGALLLTGTPMKNGKPVNLFPLLKAVRHPFGDNQKLYETQFCAGQHKQYGYGAKPVWDATGSSNLSQLHAHTRNHIFHKTKEDCLKDLLPKTREYKRVPVSSRYEIQHANAMNELAKVQADSQRSKDSEAILGAFTRLRQVASYSKIDATVALAKSILEKEPSIVIFTNFVKVAKEVHSKLGESGWTGELLTGETPQKKRQGMVDNFQEGISPVFVCTFGAGGVGLTLTAACTIILLDRPWTPGDALQAEDRVRRIGQTKAVTSIWMRAFEVDEQIDAMIEEKNQTSHAVVDGRDIAVSSSNDDRAHKSAPKISIFQLVKSIIPRNINDLQTASSCPGSSSSCGL